MPNRAIAVLETVIQNECPQAIWMDTFCVPPAEPERSAHLSHMGKLYGRANRVVIVLSPSCFKILEQIRACGNLRLDLLEILEEDPWVSRVWTYQELVNNNTIRIVAEGHGETFVSAQDLLQPVAVAIDDLKKRDGLDCYEFRKRHPRLDSLEDLIVDWKISDYLERNAYQIMSSMFARTSSRSEDYSFAMIGALSDLPAIAPADIGARPLDYFMDACEAKGDFSFIYSSGKKTSQVGRSWRPDEDDRLQPILPWHSWGEGQIGLLHSSHLELKGLAIIEQAPLSEDTLVLLTKRCERGGKSVSRESLPDVIYSQLKFAGFAGTNSFIETEFGYVFTDSDKPIRKGATIAIATGIEMVPGYPALIMYENGTGIADFAAIGILVGKVAKGDAVVHIR